MGCGVSCCKRGWLVGCNNLQTWMDVTMYNCDNVAVCKNSVLKINGFRPLSRHHGKTVKSGISCKVLKFHGKLTWIAEAERETVRVALVPIFSFPIYKLEKLIAWLYIPSKDGINRLGLLVPFNIQNCFLYEKLMNFIRVNP